VTHLRQLMLEELECRNYAPGTITNYIRTVERFAWHFHRVPDQLGPEHIRQYQAAMFREWKLSQNTVSQRLGRSTLLLHSGCGAANLNFPKTRFAASSREAQTCCVFDIDGATRR
jgi:integrase/recombinase XerD